MIAQNVTHRTWIVRDIGFVLPKWIWRITDTSVESDLDTPVTLTHCSPHHLPRRFLQPQPSSFSHTLMMDVLSFLGLAFLIVKHLLPWACPLTHPPSSVLLLTGGVKPRAKQHIGLVKQRAKCLVYIIHVLGKKTNVNVTFRTYARIYYHS